jgi:abortive infection bacteriophage resistance protein
MNKEKSNKVKKPTTFKEQVELLKRRNLIIEEEKEAIGILKRINYYRLSAYMLTYKNDDTFNGKVSIKDIYNLYEFDKKLRNLFLAVLETIEISFRTHIAYLIAHKYGAVGYKDYKNFKNKEYHEKILKSLQEEIDRSNELFVEHYKNKYEGVFPIWVAVELISFGQLSKLYSNLEDEDQDNIAKEYYGTKGRFVRTWLYSLSTFRNICAHYGRIYNRKLVITPKLFSKDKKRGIKNNTVFAIIFVIGRLLKDVDEWTSFVTNLAALIEQYVIVDLECLGFPENWEEILRSL